MNKPLKCRSDYPIEWVDGLLTEECPALTLQKYSVLFEAWSDYRQNGVYLVEGGLLKQSALCTEAFKVITGEVNKWQQKNKK